MNEFISAIVERISSLKNRAQLLIGVLCLVVGVSGLLASSFLYYQAVLHPTLPHPLTDLSSTPVSESLTNNYQTSVASAPAKLVVYVSGAVKKPGLYEVPTDARVFNAMEQAGGLTSFADSDFIQKEMNLAEKVKEGEKIYFPPYQKETDTTVSSESTISLSDAPISINSASAGQLDGLPGIGEKLAEKIISARPYETVDELVTKKVVGQSLFEKIKEMVKI